MKHSLAVLLELFFLTDDFTVAKLILSTSGENSKALLLLDFDTTKCIESIVKNELL